MFVSFKMFLKWLMKFVYQDAIVIDLLKALAWITFTHIPNIKKTYPV